MCRTRSRIIKCYVVIGAENCSVSICFWRVPASHFDEDGHRRWSADHALGHLQEVAKQRAIVQDGADLVAVKPVDGFLIPVAGLDLRTGSRRGNVDRS